MTKSTLIFGYGNLSRGDDALGPLLLEYIEQQPMLDDVDILSDYQLQVEHALDLQGRERVLFVDAAVNQRRAFDFIRLSPERDRSYSSHAMSPAAVLQVYLDITGKMPPPSYLLSIQGVTFELGESLSAVAESNLQLACRFCEQLLQQQDWAAWARQYLIQDQPVFS